jgi:hypothetical protein
MKVPMKVTETESVTMTVEEMRKFVEAKRADDPVYFGEFIRCLDRNFVRPDDKLYRKWLAAFRFTAYVLSGHDHHMLEELWDLTDEYVHKTRDGGTECYPVIFSRYCPMSTSTPKAAELLEEGYLLLGFVTIKAGETHPDSDIFEPQQIVDEVFVLDCWNKEEVEPMLRGCFAYA